MTAPVCPECRDGKPWNCTGWTIDNDDNMTTCEGTSDD
ncbi:hypothetical protein C7474_2229 [Microbacterium telephonicum]|uniref:Uncharacterized protein n=1 Tax=Microbacterium telephonicum TaxID=1714841 RepID=A0A498BUY6_9MICO|nr:hypothetical protein C7474_2229 [Microbacterium telephonicum]